MFFRQYNAGEIVQRKGPVTAGRPLAQDRMLSQKHPAKAVVVMITALHDVNNLTIEER
jgi:hypothetical protein